MVIPVVAGKRDGDCEGAAPQPSSRPICREDTLYEHHYDAKQGGDGVDVENAEHWVLRLVGEIREKPITKSLRASEQSVSPVPQ
jgi:hypothetical protein